MRKLAILDDTVTAAALGVNVGLRIRLRRPV
jgi:hypothetical protein